MAEYGVCECYSCHLRIPKPSARRVRIEVESGRSGGSFRFGSRSSSVSTGRTYYSKRDVWLCAACYAEHARSQRTRGLVNIIVLASSLVLLGGVYSSGRAPPAGTTLVERHHTAPPLESQNSTANFVRTEEVIKHAPPPSKDIAQIQTRLVELGYLTGAADGVWGTKSRTALRAFKSAHGFDADDKWDDIISRRLFSKSAVRPPLPVAKVQ